MLLKFTPAEDALKGGILALPRYVSREMDITLTFSRTSITLYKNGHFKGDLGAISVCSIVQGICSVP